MATYLVVKRLVRGDGASYAGDTLVLEPDAKETMTLLEWGYITPVPDNYKGDGGTTAPENEADGAPGTKDELMKLTRPELDALAAEEGVEGADGMANKGEVADAIMAHREAVHNAPETPTDEPSATGESDEELTEADFAKIISDLSDEDLDASLEMYEVSVEDGADRAAKEAALLEWATAHPEAFIDADETAEPEA